MHGFDILKAAVAQKASDAHFVPGMPPLFRVEGKLVPLSGAAPLASEEIQQFILPMLNERQRQKLAQDFCADFPFETETTRFRGNVLFQRNGVEAVFRIIPAVIPGMDDITLPRIVADLAMIKNGLILVTGSTGSGKSTTLACIINLINEQRRGNIITIEDPIEYVHTNKNCVVSQRELGVHVPSFGKALSFVMRQDPDVVMVGEMRDLETIAAAITVAETGHLVFGTLHANDAAQAVDRMIDVFPADQQQQIRIQLAGVLRGVIAQFLTPRITGRGLIAVREIMIVNQAVSSLIRTARTHEIHSAIEMGYREGMVTFDRALSEMAAKGLIDPRMANGNEASASAIHKKRRASDLGMSPSV